MVDLTAVWLVCCLVQRQEQFRCLVKIVRMVDALLHKTDIKTGSSTARTCRRSSTGGSMVKGATFLLESYLRVALSGHLRGRQHFAKG
jgi:hypothetical protein